MATVTATVTTTVMSTVLSSSASPSATSSNRAPSQAGVLEGANPIVYSASNPIILFIVQAAIIIVFCRLLHYPLKYLGQPRVIAEVIGGILLGPSVMMRIPGFQANIFPTLSMPILSNVANLGLILFLFLTGLEVDLRIFRRNWRVALTVSVASMALPFALGYAIAWGLYKEFGAEPGLLPISYGVFGLFVGTALAITAFPVLCRILSELNLLGNTVGVTVLAAGVGNDVVGWILLALCVSLVNNNSGLTALWALLCIVGWALLLVFAVRPSFIWLLRRNGSLQNGPTESMVCVTLLLVLTSAWFTGIVGVHPIFGGFLVGIICPHDGGFAIKLTEKVEDFVSALLLPLYFALSGLSTNLGLLDNGITWAYVIGVIAVAFFGKIIGGTLSARLCKMFWRESFSIGVLMSCKGLVELIVLNIGFQARILSQRTFTMFVVMALVTTVVTTPLTKYLYPLSYQQKTEKYRRGEIDWDGNPIGSEATSERQSVDKASLRQVRRLLVYLRLDSLPSLFTFISLIGGADTIANDDNYATAQEQLQLQEPSQKHRHLQVHGIRILELTERTSSVMKVAEVDELARRDPVVNSFRTFSQLNDVAVCGQVAVVPVASYSETLITEATETASDFVLIPWGERGLVTDDQSVLSVTASGAGRFDDRAYLDFVDTALDKAVCNTAIFIDNGLGGAAAAAPSTERPFLSRTYSVPSTHSNREQAVLPVPDKSHRIFFPFFGGADDRVALRFVLQLATNKNVTVTIARFDWANDASASCKPSDGADQDPTKGAIKSKEAALEDEPSAHDLGVLSLLRSSLPAGMSERVSFSEFTVNGSAVTVLDEVVVRAGAVVGQVPKNAGDIIVLGRRHLRFGDGVNTIGESPSSSLAPYNHDLAKTLGVSGARIIHANLRSSVLVIQAGGRNLRS
ncbi:K+/H+ antiporter 1 [Niveomyces insectorum RCEF 264]|uniref:K+/H+ antiporter 1 n=1 Tax=Niveomyces insectorum RCEF 264 TaxID=1081102 RepID=A0A167N7B2_9HYPO|nr:K+/H+ antiporter 1 [Niveomyces insectorum RCEF 264]